MYAPIIGAVGAISVMLVTAFEIFRDQTPRTWLARCYRNNRWPDKTPAFKPPREQTHALTVMPEHFDQRATPAAEHE